MEKEKSIEVTPEMIEAGARKITEEWLGFICEESTSSLWGQVLTEVFLAMKAAQPTHLFVPAYIYNNPKSIDR